jgi:nickel-dependent lactate racemase
MEKIFEQVAVAEKLLTEEQVQRAIDEGITGKFGGQKVLILIPDHTRSLPLPMLFRMLVDALSDTKQLDFMVALGTHPPLSEDHLNQLVGISAEERAAKYAHIGILNHEWDSPNALKQIGVLSKTEIQGLAGDLWHPSMGGDVPIKINARIFDYDRLLILGPTFPHEVVGFSGGAKYLFPGISGPEMINATHWMGALGGVMGTISLKDTAIRRMIHRAAISVKLPITLIALVVKGDELAGMFIGNYLDAWSKAADLSSQVHINWCEKPFNSVLSHAAPMYDELWTAAKAMYKLESVVADGGELIIYAPHLDVVSHVHGKYIYEVGYHTTQYFLKQWDKFSHIPLGVLAHSTHVKGAGTYNDGVEIPRIKVTLATKMPPEDCKKLNLGYRDPALINPGEWEEREDALYVPKAGEMLYRIKN